jgi:DNA (cytosine-5)-methyltransferase 1
MLENVEESKTWGPTTDEGYPDEKQKGKIFNSVVKALQSLGYKATYSYLFASNPYKFACVKRSLSFLSKCIDSPPRFLMSM